MATATRRKTPAAAAAAAASTAGKRRTAAKNLAVASVKLATEEQHETARRAAIANAGAVSETAGAALLDAIRATVNHGPTSPAEVAECWPTCNNPKVYASYFNAGHACHKIIGLDATLQLIDTAATSGKAKGFERALAALRSVRATAKAAGKTKEGLFGKEAKNAVAEAVATASEVGVKKPAAKRATAGATDTAVDSATLRKAAQESGQSWRELARFIDTAARAAARMAKPVGREDVASKAVTSLAMLSAFLTTEFGE